MIVYRLVSIKTNDINDKTYKKIIKCSWIPDTEFHAKKGDFVHFSQTLWVSVSQVWILELNSNSNSQLYFIPTGWLQINCSTLWIPHLQNIDNKDNYLTSYHEE